jgi:zinc protease
MNYRHGRSLFLLLALLSLLVACARPQAPTATPTPAIPSHPEQLTFEPLTFQVPEVEKMTLPNGIRLYFREDRELPLVQITAMVEAGTIGDPEPKTGQGALFAAGLRGGGAGDRSPAEMDEHLARLAADLSVGTDTYATTFTMSLRAADLPDGLAVLEDLLRRPGFDPTRLEISRRQMLEGIRRQDDNPGSVASRALMRAIYGNHPLGRTPKIETVAAVSRTDLLDFHQRYFHPNNLWLSISGDIDRQELLGMLERVFGDWTQQPLVPQQIPPVTAAPQPMVLVGSRDIPQTTILLGAIGIDKDDPDLHAVRVMNYILGGGGFNSRLMREVRSDRGLAYSVYSSYQVGRRLPGPFVSGSETRTAATVTVVQLMKEQMRNMRSQPVTAEELRLAKESLVNSFVFAFTDSHEIVAQTMRLDFYDYPPDYLQTYRDRVAAVTVDDVLQAARKHLRPDDLTVALVGQAEVFAADLAELGLPQEEIPRER